jgi:PAS domain S-box-containing protein
VQTEILVVEDEAIIAEDIRTTLRAMGYAVPRVSASGEDAVRTASERPPALALLDIRLQGHIDGIGAAEQLRELGVPVVFLTSYSDEPTLQRARGAQPFGYLLKPFDERELRATIEMALYKHRMDTKLADRERWFSTTLQSIGDGVVTADMSHCVSFMNQAAEALSGWKRREAIGQRVTDVLRVIDSRTGRPQAFGLEQALRDRAVVNLPPDVALVTKDGDAVDIDDSAAPILDARGDAVGVVVVFRDATRERKAERALRDAGERYRALFQESPWPSWIVDGDKLRFLEVNDAAIALYGYSREQFLSMELSDLGEDHPEVVRTISARGSAMHVGATRHRRCDGTMVEVDVAGNFIQTGDSKQVLILARDLTEQRRVEERLSQAQRLEALGRLAGGVAHDFNNLLAVILNYASLMLSRPKKSKEIRAELEEIEGAARRATELTRQLLAFTRQPTFQTSVVDINEVLSEFQPMLSRVLGEDVQIRMSLEPQLGGVRSDRTRIEQVVLNLVVNSRDAMPTGGKASIETANVVLDAAYAAKHPEVIAGAYVMLTVGDTGTGMDAATQARIFEPFFTTKEAGKGTGLGLSAVLGIVGQSGGHLQVSSLPGKGSTFRVYFPRAEDVSAPVRSGTMRASPVRGTETILLIEDERRLRAALAAVLQRWGYRVVEAADDEAALLACRDEKIKIDLFLSDVMLARTTGPELLDKLRPLHPQAKVLMMSGFLGRGPGEPGFIAPGTPFIQKPFTQNDLANKVREVLGALPGQKRVN